MSDIVPAVCGKPKTYIPDRECTDCEILEQRIAELEECCARVEEILSNEIELTMEDEFGELVIAHVIGWVEGNTHIKWSGLDTLDVDVGEEFDPLDGVSAIGCNDEEATITVEGGDE